MLDQITFVSGAYARTLPYELLVKIMNDSKQFAEMHGKNVQLFWKNKC